MDLHKTVHAHRLRDPQLGLLVNATEIKSVTFANEIEAILKYLEKHVPPHHILLLWPCGASEAILLQVWHHRLGRHGFFKEL